MLLQGSIIFYPF